MLGLPPRPAWALPLLLGILTAAGPGCDFSPRNDLPDAGPRDDEPPPVGPSLLLGPRGGVVAIVDRESALFAATVTVPAGALPTAMMISLEEEDVPTGTGTLGTGPVFGILPADATFSSPATVELPLPAGMLNRGLTVSRWNETMGEWQELPDVVATYDDPVALRASKLVFQTTAFGSYRATYRDQQAVTVANDGSSPITTSLAAYRFDTMSRRSYTPTPPVSVAFVRTVDAGARTELHLLPGDYVLHGLFEGESVPRCALVQVAEPTAPDPLAVTFTDATEPCALPAVRLNASSGTSRTGGDVRLTASATAGSAMDLSWFAGFTAGSISGPSAGTVPSGSAMEIAWQAPNVAGIQQVYFTVYDASGLFGTAYVTIEVDGPNQHPRIATFEVVPRTIGPGFPEGARGVAERGLPGVTAVRAVSGDLDGQPLSHFWYHALPGNFYDFDSGAKLGRDPESELVIWPETSAPYTEPSIVYMAPPLEVISAQPQGLWIPVGVSVSDGTERDRAWLMVNVAEDPATGMRDSGP